MWVAPHEAEAASRSAVAEADLIAAAGGDAFGNEVVNGLLHEGPDPDRLPELARFFLRRYNLKFRKNIQGIADSTLKILSGYWWPGNIRELENLIERLTILTPHETITLRDLPPSMRSTDQTATLKEDVLNGSRPLSDAVDEFERELIVKALQRTAD